MISYKNFLLKNTMLICVLFSTLFTMCFYFFQYESQKSLYVNNAKMYTERMAENIDSAICKVQDLPVIFHSNDDFREYAESRSVTSYQRRLIRDYLTSTINSMPGLTGRIYVATPNDYYITSSTSVTTPQFFSSAYGIPADELGDLIRNTEKKVIPETAVYFSFANGTNYFTVIMRDNMSFRQPYLIISVYDLDSLIAPAPFNAIPVIYKKDSVILPGSGSEDAGTEFSTDGRMPNGYMVLYRKTPSESAADILSYALVAKRADFFMFVNRYIFYTILLGILFFILSYIFSNIIANKSHKPIKEIVDKISNIKESEGTKNELEQISSAISLLASRNRQLSSTMDANGKQLREKFVNDLMNNRLTNAQIQYGINNYVAEYADAFPLALVMISIDGYPPKHSSENTNNSLAYYNIIKSLLEGAFPKSRFFHFTSIPSLSYCAVLSDTDPAQLNTVLRSMILKAETELGIELHATIGDTVTDWKELPTAFSAAYLSHSASVSDTYSLVSDNDKKMTFFYSSELDEKLYMSCIQQDLQTMEYNIDLVIAKNFPSEEMFLRNLAPLSLVMYALCTRILTTLDISPTEIYEPDIDIYHDLTSCRDKDEFRRNVLYIMSRIIEYNSSSKTDYEKVYCDKMLDFIHNNYKNNISLTDIAAYMNMSQAYVSRLFKKLVGSNFKNYLTRVRLDNAAKLLLESPDKTVADISQMCGFSSPRTFTNTFSTSFGMTPTEYRRKYLK